MKTILVIGATGHFGARFCRRILSAPNLKLLVSSRSKASARRLASELRETRPQATVDSVALDQTAPEFAAALCSLQPDIVVHSAGPYQGQSYVVAKVCMRAGAHYIDLADSREFVAGFGELNDAALASKVLLVSGASTLPGLSSVVVDAHRIDFKRMHAINISIAPGHKTPRGRGTIAAVLSYCGKPFEVLQSGQAVVKYGWQNLRCERYPELGRRISAACDVPDLALFPHFVDGIQTVTFQAALEARREQLALWLMAAMTRLGLKRDWCSLTPVVKRLSDACINWGSDIGGMQIRMSGEGADGTQASRTWSLIARNNHGPEIPCTPALIIARQLLSDTLSVRGAMPCLGMFTLADFQREIAALDIRFSTSSD